MKKLMSLISVIILSTACSESNDPVLNQVNEETIKICHYDSADDSWILGDINITDWFDHEIHGDIRLIDLDNDGFVPTNACGFGQMGDHDDNDDTIFPGAVEICEDGIDQDCDGEDLVCECPCFSYEDLAAVNFEEWTQLTWDISIISLNYLPFGSPVGAYVTAGWDHVDPNGIIMGGIDDVFVVDNTDGVPMWTPETKPECAGLRDVEIIACQKVMCQKVTDLLGGLIECDSYFDNATTQTDVVKEFDKSDGIIIQK